MDAATFIQQIATVDRTSFVNETERLKALDAIHALHLRVETPYETVLRWVWVDLQRDNALKIAVDTRLLRVLAGGKPADTAALAAATTPPIPTELAERVLRQLAASRVVHEAGAGVWQSNDLSERLATPTFEAAIIGLFQTFRGTLALPELLEHHVSPPYTPPTDPAATAWSLGNNRPGESLFDSFARTPALGAAFSDLMVFFATLRPRSWDIYPVADRLLPGAKSGTPFMVDLGGSRGHDLKALRAAHPSTASLGPLVDLDRPDLIAANKDQLAAAGIEACAHDFFKPLPASVAGARAYFLHQIIHDWNDELSRDILANICDAMTPGYSVLLIHEVVIPAMGAGELACALDLIMMGNVAAKERTEGEFRELVEGVKGLKVQGVFRDKGGNGEAVIEIGRVE